MDIEILSDAHTRVSERQSTAPLYTLEELVTQWLLTCGGAKTRKAYGLEFRQFLNFAQQRFVTLELPMLAGIVSNAYAANIKDATESRKMAANTAARKLCSVSSFFNYCAAKDIIRKNVFEHIKRPKLPSQSSREALTADEVTQIYAILAKQLEIGDQSKKHSVRKAAHFQNVLVRSLLETGMRIAELLQMRACDIEILEDFARLTLHRKGDEIEKILVVKEVGQRLHTWQQIFCESNSPTECFFIEGMTFESVHNRVLRIVARLAKDAGISKKVTPHVFRATVATTLHSQGVPPLHIQRLLNHKDFKTTQRYIQKMDEVKEAAALKISWQQER